MLSNPVQKRFRSVLWQLTALSALMAVGLNAKVTAAESNQRWFEIEVILLQQLSDKGAMNEAFESSQVTHNALTKKQPIALVTKELNKLLNLKQQLGNCPPSFVLHPNTQSTDMTLTAQQHLEQSGIGYDSPLVAINASTASDSDVNGEPANDDTTSRIAMVRKLLNDESIKIEGYQGAPEFALYHNQTTTQTSPTTSVTTPSAASEGGITNGALTDTLTDGSADVTLPRELTQSDCPSSFSDIESVASHYYQIPRIIVGDQHQHASSEYLLTSEQLQLANIRQAMSRSKEFRPVLHLGWRQVGKPLAQARPVKLIAGNNHLLAAQSQPNEQTTLTRTDADSIIRQHIIETINATQTMTDASQQIALTAEALSPLVDESTISDADITLAPVMQSKVDAAQAFTFDGLFQVHLNHYLFIDAFFNVLDKNQDGETITIPFKQTRRVISGEIHYFDHPYMGMIVQIRRFQPPKHDDAIDVTGTDVHSSLGE
ncbi:CsiV family protein [Thalassotalea maritima]|uniref:CsiV family protein n=1 Tax=Thalassotalea maritima TaxID=3242416 RepID=UPI003526F519